MADYAFCEAVYGEVGSIEVPHRLHAPAVDVGTTCRTGPLLVPFGSGEVQLVARGGDLVLDITARHFDTTGYPRREHAYGTLTRGETQCLIAALVAFLANTPDTQEAA
jgi:hypothetical protein